MSDSSSIGDIGETLFQLWCQNTGITANKPQKDNFGWDFFVQFTNQPFTTATGEKLVDVVSALVQVKTTKNPKDAVYIKLSNWNSLVKNPSPAFVVYIVLDQQNNSERIALTHIDEHYISVTLRQMRISSEDLHKRKLVYSPRKEDWITKDFAAEIRRRMIEVLKGTLSDYSKRKIQTVETIGYTDVRNRGSFKLRGSLSEIVDFSIGLTKEIDVFEGRIESDIRFGIPGSVEQFDVAKIQIKPQGRTIKMKFVGRSGDSVSVLGTVMTPFAFFSSIPIEVAKFRIACLIGDLIFEGESRMSGNFTFQLTKEKHPYPDQIKIAKLACLFADKTSGFDIETFESGKFLGKLRVSPENLSNIELDSEFIKVAQAYVFLDSIFHRIGHEQQHSLSYNEIEFFQSTIFETSLLLGCSPAATLMFGFTLASELGLDERVVIPRLTWFRVGQNYFLFQILYFGVPILVDHVEEGFKYQCVVDSKLINQLTTETPDSEKTRSDYEALLKIAEQYEEYRILELK